MRKVFNNIGNVSKWRRNLFRVDLAEDLIMYDVIMARASCALERGVCLEEEVPVAGFSHAAINDSTGLRIARAPLTTTVAIFLSCWVEARFVSLTADDDREARKAFFGICRWVHCLTCFPQLGKLLREHHIVLSL